MITLSFSKSQIDQLEIDSGLQELSKDYGFQVSYGHEGTEVTLLHEPGDKLWVDCWENCARFRFDFARRNHFFRCLGLLLEQLNYGVTTIHLEEKAWFRHNGPGFDLCQGNAALHLDRMKWMLRRCAMMGMSQCVMYMEDTFDVPEEPYFGWMRSRYTHEELKELDDYGYALGIELIPSVQSLAHLRDVLKWEVYRELREDEDCLVPGQEATYTFLRHTITAASSCFRTRRINLVMDEAHGVGQGTYLRRNGWVNKSVILKKHLERVLEITRELGLHPMIADDMFFRDLGGHKNPNVVIPDGYADTMPKGVDLMYWDYDTVKEEDYFKLLNLRKQLTDHVVYEGGIWNWVGFSPNWMKTFTTMNAALSACKEAGVDDIHANTWGDSGTECDIRVALLGFQFFAEHGFMREAPSEEHLRRRFRFCTGGDYDLFLGLQLFDYIPGVDKDHLRKQNPSKFLLWQDPLCGLFENNIEGLPLKEHYERLLQRLETADYGCFQSMFELYRLLARVMVLKCQLGLDIRNAYLNGDKQTLEQIRAEVIPELMVRIRELRAHHHICWEENYKTLGWEIFDMRYGSLLIRLETTSETLGRFLDGSLSQIPELDEKRLPYNGVPGIPRHANFYGRIVSASRIAPEDMLNRPKGIL